MTQAYEIMLILDPSGREEDHKKMTGEIDEILRKIDGSIEHSTHIGRRRLAYEINHKVEGYYYLVRFHAESLRVRELERVLQLHEGVIRFMVLTADNAPLQEPIFKSESSEAPAERS